MMNSEWMNDRMNLILTTIKQSIIQQFNHSFLDGY